MDIIKEQHTIAEIVKGYTGYKDVNMEESLVGFDGKLDIRPAYQRLFVYEKGNDVEKRNLVIDTVKKGFPLNTMYWNTKDDGTYEVLDGQQRTLSICQYVANKYNIDGKYFNNLPDNIQQEILDYKLDIYKCTGTPSERQEWFEVINIAGVKLEPQEILNAIYTGPWLIEAKRYFSRTNCPAKELGRNFMSGTPIRQDLLETALKWRSGSKNKIKEYMGKFQHKSNADDLINYFESVISWVNDIFIGSKKDIKPDMKKVEWGFLYDKYGKGKTLDSEYIRNRVAEIQKAEDIKKRYGIYEYVLDGERSTKFLDIRNFLDSEREFAYDKQGGICANKKDCPKQGEICSFDEMEADHMEPWIEGGRTTPDNCQMLCRDCNRRKGAV